MYIHTSTINTLSTYIHTYINNTLGIQKYSHYKLHTYVHMYLCIMIISWYMIIIISVSTKPINSTEAWERVKIPKLKYTSEWNKKKNAKWKKNCKPIYISLTPLKTPCHYYIHTYIHSSVKPQLSDYQITEQLSQNT